MLPNLRPQKCSFHLPPGFCTFYHMITKKMGIVLTVVSISKYFGTLYAAENITTIVKMYFFHLNGNKDSTYTEIY